MSRPSIAYVVPAYNAAATLGNTLASVRAQTRGDWEAVVVDDGSRDETAAVGAATGDPRVRVHRQENRGLSGARNAGLERIGAPLVCFLDADDTIEPTHAASFIQALEGGADLGACWFRYVGPALEDLGWTVPIGAQDLTPDRLLELNSLAVGGVCVRVESARRAMVGGELFRTALPLAEEWDLWMRMTRGGSRWAEPVREPLFNYRLRPDSMSTDLRLMWRIGVELISGAGAGDREREAALRSWAVRNLARAVAGDDAGLTRELLAAIGGVHEVDLGVLAGALRWAFCRRELIGPSAAAHRIEFWKERTRAMLAAERLVNEIASRLAASATRWEDAVGRAAARVGEGESLVIYGLGRNGQEALAAAKRAGIGVAAVDDSPAARADVTRLRAEELTDRHIVLVTPDDRADIVQRLARLGVRRVVLPDGA